MTNKEAVRWLKTIKYGFDIPKFNESLNMAISALEEKQTNTAEWLPADYLNKIYRCSKCGQRSINKYPYCMWCGSRMKGENQ